MSTDSIKLQSVASPLRVQTENSCQKSMSIPALTITIVRNIFQIFLFPPECNLEPVISSASKQTQRCVVSTSELFVSLKTVSLIAEIFKTVSASQELAVALLLRNDS